MELLDSLGFLQQLQELYQDARPSYTHEGH
jgi:hypothetical protein